MPPPRLALSSNHPAIFVNRDHPLALINNAIERLSIGEMRLLVFHGIGGQGKTALCQYVVDEVSAKKQPIYKNLLAAEVDLRGRDKTDAINLLVWIRNGFAKVKVSCAAFDIALALTWEATRPEQPFPKLTNAWLSKSSELMGDASPDIVTSVREAVEQSVETIPLLGPLTTKGSKWVIDKSKAAYLHDTRPYLEHLYAANGEPKKSYELEALLPWMLAQDLNKHLKGRPYERFLLLVDEYERVFEQGGAGRKWEDNTFDAAMRRFIAETNGLLAVFFTREPLPWDKSNDWKDSLAGNQHPLEGLDDDYTREWLAQAGVKEADIQSAMIEGAREAPGQAIYPLLLELQLEHWRQLTINNEPANAERFHISADSLSARCQEMVKRVLRDYGADLQLVIERLSVSLRFDKIAFEHVIKSFQLGLSLDIFDQVKRLSLFKMADDGYVSMHRAFADIVIETLEPEQKRESIELLLEHYQKRSKAPTVIEIGEEHVLSLFEAAYLRRGLEPEGYVDWLFRISDGLSKSAHSGKGEELWLTALNYTCNNFGEEHPDTATCYNSLGTALEKNGRYAEAACMLKKGLDIRKKVLGKQHFDTAASYNNVAINLDYQGQFQEAEKHFKHAISIWNEVLHENHQAIAKCTNNLAGTLNEQWKYEDAKRMCLDALSVLKACFGEMSSDVASCYNNLASSLRGLKRLGEAEEYIRKSLAIYQELYSEEHPSFANACRNLAANLNDQQRYVEAEPVCRQALDISRKLIGDKHPDIAVSCNNLAFNLNAQERYSEADPFYREALSICRETLGNNHINTAMALNGVAYNLDKMGQSEEAEPLLTKAVNIVRQVHGQDHPFTKKMEHNLEGLLANISRK